MKPPAAPEATSRLPSAAPRDRAILQAASAPSQSSIVTRAGARGMPGTDRPVVRTAKAEQRRKKAQGKLHLDSSFDIYWCDEFIYHSVDFRFTRWLKCLRLRFATFVVVDLLAKFLVDSANECGVPAQCCIETPETGTDTGFTFVSVSCQMFQYVSGVSGYRISLGEATVFWDVYKAT